MGNFALARDDVLDFMLHLLPAIYNDNYVGRSVKRVPKHSSHHSLLHCHLQVAMRTHYFTWINAVMISLSIGCWLPALWAFSSVQPLQRMLTDMVELGPHLFRTPAFWLGVVVLAPVMALLLDFILSSWQRQRQPLDRQIFQVSARVPVWGFVSQLL